jgi:hypothetical protein
VDVAFGLYLHPVPDKHIVNDDRYGTLRPPFGWFDSLALRPTARVRPYRPMPIFCEDTIIQVGDPPPQSPQGA